MEWIFPEYHGTSRRQITFQYNPETVFKLHYMEINAEREFVARSEKIVKNAVNV